ncbi:MAG: sulfatase [Proteobacteria bacterium ST_bin13]|nr:MAG: sulfatase [Proteobacteria bacterium ST_bin13]
MLFDDVGFTDFGAYGSNSRTPNIDGLARKGAMLSRYYTSPFCGPSRAMLVTGMDNHQVGMGTLVETLKPEMRSLPGYSMVWNEKQHTIGTLFSAAGYQTYVTGKWGIGEVGANLPNAFGFDRSFVMDATGGSNYDKSSYLPAHKESAWFEDGKPTELPSDWYSSRSLVDKMIEYIDKGDSDKPFLGFLALQAVHIPVHAPTSFIERYDGTFAGGWDLMRKQRHERAIKLGLVPATTKLQAAPEAHRRWDSLSPGEQRVAAREMQVNAGMMEAADFHIGRLMKHLDEAGQLENTIVVITSDNGPESGMTRLEGVAGAAVELVNWMEGRNTASENMGQPGSLTAIGPEWASVSAAPFNLYKFYASEGGLRVPLVVAGPGISQKGIVDAPMHVADLLPTLLEAAEVEYNPAIFYGQSAFPMLSGESGETYAEDESFGFEVSGNAALYRGKWKITRNFPPRGDGEWRLFDISVDPGETNDLSAKNAKLFESMKAEYASYSQQVGVVELEAGDSAIKQLTNKLVSGVLHKYWPYLLGLGLAFVAFGYLLFRTVRLAGRPKPA